MRNAERPRRRTDVLTEYLPDGSGLVYDPRTDLAYPLTASAAAVWETCDGTHTVDALADELYALYESPSDVIARDVQELLGRLTEAGLLESAPGAGG